MDGRDQLGKMKYELTALKNLPKFLSVLAVK